MERKKASNKNARTETISSSHQSASSTGSTYEEINAVNLDSCTHLPNEKQQATFKCLPQETRNKVTCNIEEKRITVLRDGKKDNQPPLSLNPSNSALNQVFTIN